VRLGLLELSELRLRRLQLSLSCRQRLCVGLSLRLSLSLGLSLSLSQRCLCGGCACALSAQPLAALRQITRSILQRNATQHNTTHRDAPRQHHIY
jgi:hypothetical protein